VLATELLGPEEGVATRRSYHCCVLTGTKWKLGQGRGGSIVSRLDANTRSIAYRQSTSA
jgi:hypothetical protein